MREAKQAEEPLGVTALAPVFACKYDYGKQKETKNNMDIVESVDSIAPFADCVRKRE